MIEAVLSSAEVRTAAAMVAARAAAHCLSFCQLLDRPPPVAEVIHAADPLARRTHSTPPAPLEKLGEVVENLGRLIDPPRPQTHIARLVVRCRHLLLPGPLMHQLSFRSPDGATWWMRYFPPLPGEQALRAVLDFVRSQWLLAERAPRTPPELVLRQDFGKVRAPARDLQEALEATALAFRREAQWGSFRVEVRVPPEAPGLSTRHAGLSLSWYDEMFVFSEDWQAAEEMLEGLEAPAGSTPAAPPSRLPPPPT